MDPLTSPAGPTASVSFTGPVSRHAYWAALSPHRWRLRTIITLSVLFGFLLRAGVGMIPAYHHPDELFQYLEQAHRLVFGYGIVTWDMRYGIRSWVLPLLISGPMALGEILSPGGTLYLLLPRLMLSAVSLSLIISSALLGQQISRLHAILAAFVTATWFDIVYFGPRVLTEAVSIAVFMPAALLLSQAETRSARRLAAAGFLLGLCGILRFQYLPALAVLAAFHCRWHFRRCWLPLILGGCGALALSSAVDIAMGQIPFSWIFNNFRENIVNSRAAGFGTQPLSYYITYLRPLWAFAIVPILLTARLGAKRFPALFWVAVVALVTHACIGHKEYRYILLTTTIVIFLSAVGTGDMVRWAQQRVQGRHALLPVYGAILLWAAMSLALSFGERMRIYWTSFNQGISAVSMVGRQPQACGVALYGLPFSGTGGYTYLHRPIPIYQFDTHLLSLSPGRVAAELNRSSPAFNFLIASADVAANVPPGYRKVNCWSQPKGISEQLPAANRALCAYERAGGCTGNIAARYEINRLLIHIDQ